MENSKENDNENKADSESANKTEKEDDSKIGIEKKKLEQALKNARLEHQVIIIQYLFSTYTIVLRLNNKYKLTGPIKI
jgi:hypothetical protein